MPLEKQIEQFAKGLTFSNKPRPISFQNWMIREQRARETPEQRRIREYNAAYRDKKRRERNEQ